MNILFLTIAKLKNLDDTMLYTEMLHTFASRGHDVYAICPIEKRDGIADYIEHKGNVRLLHANIGGDYFQADMIEKGLTLLKMENRYINAINTHYKDVQFDLVLYTTPPITFNRSIKYFKNRDGAVSYLMLKDIFPQNAVDLGLLPKKGMRRFLYDYFRKKEKLLYGVSDYIGCMSPANIAYVKTHNPEVDPNKLELLPNSTIIKECIISGFQRDNIRKKYNIPLDKKVFIYGGNFGKPQGVDYIIDCLKVTDSSQVHFVIVGEGTEFYKVQNYIDRVRPKHVSLIEKLPKTEYDMLVCACDVGLIFLDHRFTIPNFPSRLLSYMQAKLPVLAATDPNTDIGDIIVEGGFGWWCESNDADCFKDCVNNINSLDLGVFGERSYQYLVAHYDVKDAVEGILKHMK